MAAILALMLAVGALTPPAHARTLSNLRKLARHAKVSVMVVRLGDMHTLAALNPDKRLTPASTSKLFTAAAALSHLGPRHRFTTRLASNGSLANGVVDGNLILIGDGDPMFDLNRLRHLVDRLAARGVETIQGDVIVDESKFGDVPCVTPDRCAAHDRSSHAYDAPVSAAGMNFATVHATVYAAARVGNRPRVVLHPPELGGITIDNQARTKAAGSHAYLRAWRTSKNGQNVLHLRGHLPVGGRPVEIHRSVSSAPRETARALAAVLARHDIDVDGRLFIRGQAGPDQLTTLARVHSRPLSAQLIPMMAYSNNYMADMLTLDIATAAGYHRPLTLPRAARPLEAFAKRALARTYPNTAGGSGAQFESGSGLTVANSVSARDLISVLATMYHRTALFPAFYGSLPVPRSSPHHMLKNAPPAFLNRLAAKTGTLSEPVSVRALAGYMRLKNGDFAAYAVLINGTASRPHLGFSETVGAYEHDLTALLARY